MEQSARGKGASPSRRPETQKVQIWTGKCSRLHESFNHSLWSTSRLSQKDGFKLPDFAVGVRAAGDAIVYLIIELKWVASNTSELQSTSLSTMKTRPARGSLPDNVVFDIDEKF
jgi:hypothetical protein